jgi:phospho-N-acetylmuramoyl-pentapeptide-transferase
MLYLLFFQILQPAAPFLRILRVFGYITVRTALASLTALLMGLLLGPSMIKFLRGMQIKQFIREEGPASHQGKAGTPTMGGLLIVMSTIVPTLLWADLTNAYVLMAIFVMLGFAAVGFVDDYSKVVRKHNRGLTGRAKFLMQVIVSVCAGIALLVMTLYGVYSTALIVPFFKNFRPDLVSHALSATTYFWPLAFIPFLAFVALVMVGSSNAVNLTDGLDGLAIGCVVIAAGALTVLTYVTSHAGFSAYLDIQHVPQVGELTIFCGALVGSSLSFLWYNAHPAEVFMGDVGSLCLGGAIGYVAVAIKQEILLFSVGGIFVLEAVSVILQVASFKMTGKRIFRMAPLHHHFELAGWSESKVIVRFWIAALIFALFSLTTLKLR